MSEDLSPVEVEHGDEHELSGSQMTFGEHLEELRGRIFRAVVGSILGLLLCFVFHRTLLNLVTAPYREVMEELGQSTALKAFGPSSAFLGYIKVSFIAGLILTAPWWMYQLWAFVAAGLYDREKRHVYRYAPLCVLLFFGGALFGYTTLIPIGLRYLLTFGDPGVVQNWVGLSEYLKLFSILTLLLGLAFQLPVAMLVLAKTGMCTTQTFREKRKIVILVLFVVGALFTPPDPATQLLLAAPLCGLYELGIFFVWLAGGGKLPAFRFETFRKRGLKVVAAVLLLVVAWGPLTAAWRSQRADGMVIRRGQDDDAILKSMSVFLHAEIDAALRARNEGSRSLWVVRVGDAIRIIDQDSDRDQLVVLARDRDGEAATMRFMLSASGVVTHTLKRRDAVPYQEFVPGLLEALEHGSEETRQLAWKLLDPLRPERNAVAEDQRVATLRAWYEQNEKTSFAQAE